MMSSSTPDIPSPIAAAMDAVEGARVLDRPAGVAGEVVRRLTAPPPIKDALRGAWLGHAAHPLLTDVVVGSFLSATILDVLGGDHAASERLIAVGILAYAPTALTGASDWADAEAGDAGVRRAGLTHAALNASALALYASSLAARRRGARFRGKALGAAGAAALGAAAYLGGHLTFAKGVRVSAHAHPSSR